MDILIFEIVSPYIVQAGLKLITALWCQYHKCWHHTSAPSQSTSSWDFSCLQQGLLLPQLYFLYHHWFALGIKWADGMNGCRIVLSFSPSISTHRTAMSSQPWATRRNTELNMLLALPCTDSCHGLNMAVWAHCLSNMWLDVDVLWLSSGTFCLLLLKNRQYTGGNGHGSCGSTLYLPFLFLNRLMWFHFHPSLLRSLCLQIYHRYKWDSCL